jgi:hypothetical protein
MTDTSNEAAGAVLLQGKVGSDVPVAYGSRTFHRAENYSAIQKVLATIVWGVKRFRICCMVEDSELLVITN